MSDKYAHLATRRLPPVAGEVTALAGTTTSPAAVDLLAGAEERVWYTFQADSVDAYLVFGKESADVATAPLGTAVSGNGRAIHIPAGASIDFEIDNDRNWMRWVTPSAAGYVRYFKTSPQTP